MRVEEVHDIRMKRAQVNHQTYKQLYQACCERIRRRAAVPNAACAMYYQVPAFVWGRPPFTHSHAARYVSEKLRRNGFHVTEPCPGTLYVDWMRPRKHKAKRAPPGPAKPKPSARLAALRGLLA